MRVSVTSSMLKFARATWRRRKRVSAAEGIAAMKVPAPRPDPPEERTTPEAFEDPQGLADAGPTDTELRGQVTLGRQGVADRERTGHDLFLDGIDDELIRARPGHRLPRGGVVFAHGLLHRIIISCLSLQDRPVNFFGDGPVRFVRDRPSVMSSLGNRPAHPREDRSAGNFGRTLDPDHTAVLCSL
jgi:hypothetical protein